MDLPKKLKKLRNQKKLLQKDVAKILSMSVSGYCQYETGQRTPDIETLKKLANLYDVNVDYLVGKNFDFKSTQELITEELNSDIGIHFYDPSKVTPEKIKKLKQLWKIIMDEDE